VNQQAFAQTLTGLIEWGGIGFIVGLAVSLCVRLGGR
jgi:hypothetical protein